MHLQLALGEACAEGRDALGAYDVAVGLELGHLVLQGDEADGGALLLLQPKELQDALVVLHVAVDEDEQDLGGGGGGNATARLSPIVGFALN